MDQLISGEIHDPHAVLAQLCGLGVYLKRPEEYRHGFDG